MFSECLKKVTIFENASPSIVSSYVKRHVGMHAMHVSKNAKKAMIRYAPMGDLGLSMISYGDFVTATNSTGLDCYHFHMVIAGSCNIEMGGRSLDLHSGFAAIMSPSLPTSVSYDADCVKIMVDIPRQLFLSGAVGGAGSAPAEGVLFEPVAVDISGDAVACKLLEVLMLAAEYHPRAPRLLQNPLQQTFTSKLLDVFPSNAFSVAPGRDNGEFLSGIDSFIDSHIHEEITLARLAIECGVSERTLCNRFQQHAGVSPSRYLKNRRLYHMYSLLSQPAGAVVNVTDLAFQLGFNHLGRLSADYKAMFGELPSETLRRYRQLSTH